MMSLIITIVFIVDIPITSTVITSGKIHFVYVTTIVMLSVTTLSSTDSVTSTDGMCIV